MKRCIKLLGIPMVVLLLIAATCNNASKVTMYVNLAVDATTNGLRLAESFGAQVPQTTLDEVSRDGDLVKKAVADWTTADNAAKPGAWDAVQAALDIFKNNLPAILQAVHINNPAYSAIVSLALTAVEEVVNVVQSLNPQTAAAAKVSRFSVTEYKSKYNSQMLAASHPELSLK